MVFDVFTLFCNQRFEWKINVFYLSFKQIQSTFDFFYIMRLSLSAHKNRLSEFVSSGHYEKFISWFQSIGSSSKFQIKIDSPTKVVFRCVNIVCLWTHDIIWITQKHNKVFWNYFIIWYYVGLFITSFSLNYCLILLTV